MHYSLSLEIQRYNGQIVKLSYAPTTGTPTKEVYFVGSGVTLDTGGLDLKVSHTMPGHHRDKCGAAAIVGFFKMLDLIQPKALVKYSATLGILRNNLGSESYSTDEIIMSRSKRRIKIGYTDAEARLYMSDLLYEQIEQVGL